jgi:AraC-like DNA-binding protein
LISEGRGEITTASDAFEVARGSLVYIPAGLKHDWIADRDDPMVHVCCYFDWSYRDRQAYSTSASIIFFDDSKVNPSLIGPHFPYPIRMTSQVDTLSKWMELFEKFYTPNQHANEKTFMHNMKVQHHFLQFIELFLSQVLKEEHYIPDLRIQKVLKQLDYDLLHGRILPLATYYRSIHVSRGYFHELFRHTTGMPPTQYIHHQRIQHAKEDVLHSDLSITEIAEKHHFSSIHYFSKLFKQVTGKNPSEFRA